MFFYVCLTTNIVPPWPVAGPILTMLFPNLSQKYVNKEQTSASLETLMRTGRGELLRKTYKDETSAWDHQQATERIILQVASFLHREMPIRLAHRIRDLDQVPLMRDMPSVKKVKETYINSFLGLVDLPKIKTLDDEDRFANTLERLYEKHSNVLIQMARGAFELREAVRIGRMDGIMPKRGSFEQMDECHEFLDRFYTSRIGIRVLAGQYLALRGEPLTNYVGMICSTTSPHELVQHAVNDARMMCTRKYGDAPDVHVLGRLDLTFPYIPTHLHYMLLELLKNAMRATMDKHEFSDDIPPVTVIISDGTDNEDVVIKIADEGGGIPRSNMKKIWSYLFTTADPSIQESFIAGSDFSTDSPLAGLGVGIPISRAYARYFGGDLDIMSMEGFGTDAFIYLQRLGQSREPLPV